jgi:hypothetical protein
VLLTDQSAGCVTELCTYRPTLPSNHGGRGGARCPASFAHGPQMPVYLTQHVPSVEGREHFAHWGQGR